MCRLLGGVAKCKLCGRPGRGGVITLRTKADKGGGEGELIDFFADVLYGWSLSTFGIGAKTLGWIKTFLSGRSQSVQINDAYSSCSAVVKGVAQSNILGPLLLTVAPLA